MALSRIRAALPGIRSADGSDGRIVRAQRSNRRGAAATPAPQRRHARAPGHERTETTSHRCGADATPAPAAAAPRPVRPSRRRGVLRRRHDRPLRRAGAVTAIVSLTQGEAGQIRDVARRDPADARRPSGSRSSTSPRPRWASTTSRASTWATAASHARPSTSSPASSAASSTTSRPTWSSRSVPTAGSGTPTTSPRASRRVEAVRAHGRTAPAAARQVPDARQLMVDLLVEWLTSSRSGSTGPPGSGTR